MRAQNLAIKFRRYAIEIRIIEIRIIEILIIIIESGIEILISLLLLLFIILLKKVSQNMDIDSWRYAASAIAISNSSSDITTAAR